MSQQDAFDRVLTSLSKATFDDAHWSAASAQIDDACGIKGNHLTYALGNSHDNVEILFSRLYYRGQCCEELEREYLSNYYPIDERIPRVRLLPDGKVVHIGKLYSSHELKTSPVYNEALPRGDYQNGLSVRLDGPSGTRIGLTIADPINGDDWSSAQIDMIKRILPHLRQYVSFRQALVDAQALGRSLTGLLDNGGLSVFQLDRRGRIVEANESARALLRRGDGLYDQGGILRAWSPSDDAEIQRQLDAHCRASVAKARPVR